MGYRLAADAILIVHTAFIAFVVLGLLVILVGGVVGWRAVRNIWFRVIHLACIGYVVVQAWLGLVCPLTIWESELRVLAGEDPYAPQGFIATWLQRLIFFEGESWVFTLAYSLFGLAVLVTLIFVPPRWKQLGSPRRA
jgi:hypothetical protein